MIEGVMNLKGNCIVFKENDGLIYIFERFKNMNLGERMDDKNKDELRWVWILKKWEDGVLLIEKK
jgi:hypothetical protein